MSVFLAISTAATVLLTYEPLSTPVDHGRYRVGDVGPPELRTIYDYVEEARHHMRAQGHRAPPVALSLATLAPCARPVRSVRCVRRRVSWTRALGAVRERRPTRRALRTWERDLATDSAADST